MQSVISWVFHNNFIELFLAFFTLINVITFLLYVIDKRKAVKNKWRIKERTLIFFTLAFGGVGALLGMCIARHKTKNKKFIFAVVLGLVIVLVPVIHIVHSATLDRIISYTEIEFRSENWPTELDGYRIAFIADTHFISEERLWSVVHELNERELNLALLGGDFAWDTYKMQKTIEILSYIETTDGIYGVEGNHDRRGLLFSKMEEREITPLSNSGVYVRENFFLAGVEDTWRNPSIQDALVGSQPEDFVLLISHNPDIVMRQDTADVNLILSGHTHGGQMTFFGIWAPYFTFTTSITAYGQRFRSGWALSRDNTPVFVSNGVGEYMPRIFARPQVILINMFSE